MGYAFKGTLTIGQQFIRDNAPKYMNGLGNTAEEFEAIQYAHEQGVKIVFDPSCVNANIPFEEAQKLYIQANQ